MEIYLNVFEDGKIKPGNDINALAIYSIYWTEVKSGIISLRYVRNINKISVFKILYTNLQPCSSELCYLCIFNDKIGYASIGSLEHLEKGDSSNIYFYNFNEIEFDVFVVVNKKEILQKCKV